MKAIVREVSLDKYSEEEVADIVQDAMEHTGISATLFAKAIIFTKLRDKFGFSTEQLQQLENMSYDEDLTEVIHDLMAMEDESVSMLGFFTKYFKTEFGVTFMPLEQKED